MKPDGLQYQYCINICLSGNLFLQLDIAMLLDAICTYMVDGLLGHVHA